MKKASVFLLVNLYYLLLLQSYSQERRVIERLDFKDTIFSNPVDYSKCDFISKVVLTEVRFDSTANFMRSKFESSASFSHSQFVSDVYFSPTTFASTLFLSHVDFDSSAYFLGMRVGSTAIFNDSEFGGHITDFSTTVFNGVYFKRVRFESYADFKLAKFKSFVNFTSIVFGSIADFRRARFDSLADFSEAEFKSEIYLDGAILPERLDLSGITKIKNEIDLTRTEKTVKYNVYYIKLTGSAIDKIKLRYKRFKLWFRKDRLVDYELKSNVYTELLKKQKDEGFTQSYEILDKEYREFQYTDTESQYSWLWGHTINWIDKNWWGYGYDKELIVRNVILIYLLLSMINAFMLKHFTVNVYIADKINEWRNETQGSKTSKFFKSIPFSMFYTAQIFFGLKFDVEKLKYKENLQGWKIFNLIYFFFIYLGGFVCLAYLANYVITV